jgi:hypothetical protein
MNRPVFDASTLHSILEERPGCRIMVLKKGLGPIAALHGIQYSLSVVKNYQSEISLQRFVPPESVSDPQAGIITNVSFLLHVSETVWREQVLPGLKDAFTSRALSHENFENH